MTREIRSRGISVVTGEWVYGSLIIREDSFGTIYIIEFKQSEFVYKQHQVKPETVGQYTGLKDKNGVEIYEGDILERCQRTSFVVWSLDSWRFNSYMPDSMHLYPSVDKTRGKDYELAEVIGSIHTHPELINK